MTFRNNVLNFKTSGAFNITFRETFIFGVQINAKLDDFTFDLFIILNKNRTFHRSVYGLKISGIDAARAVIY